MVAALGVIAHDGASRPSPQVDGGRHLPAAVLGPFDRIDDDQLTTHHLLALLGVIALAYAVMVLANGFELRMVAAVIFVAYAVAVLIPPTSTDVFSYLSYARLGVLH